MLSKVEDLKSLVPGDVIRYDSNSHRHARHGMAIKCNSGKFKDTYYGNTYTEDPPWPNEVSADFLEESFFLGNVNDYTEHVPYPFVLNDYSWDDRLVFPIGLWSRKDLVKKGAKPVYEQVQTRLRTKVKGLMIDLEYAKEEQARLLSMFFFGSVKGAGE